MPAKGKKTESFEGALKKLEKIVVQLEDGDLPLEEAIRAFEAGTQLVQTCEARLSEARKKIEVLMGKQAKEFKWEDEDESV